MVSGSFLFTHIMKNKDIGAHVDIVIGGFDEDAEVDNIGPVIDLYMNNIDFRTEVSLMLTQVCMQ